MSTVLLDLTLLPYLLNWHAARPMEDLLHPRRCIVLTCGGSAISGQIPVKSCRRSASSRSSRSCSAASAASQGLSRLSAVYSLCAGGRLRLGGRCAAAGLLPTIALPPPTAGRSTSPAPIATAVPTPRDASSCWGTSLISTFPWPRPRAPLPRPLPRPVLVPADTWRTARPASCWPRPRLALLAEAGAPPAPNAAYVTVERCRQLGLFCAQQQNNSPPEGMIE